MKKTLVILGAVIAVLLALVLVVLLNIRSRTSARNTPPAPDFPAVAGTRIDIAGALHMTNIVLLNPAGFTEREFVSVPEFYVDADTGTLAGKGAKHIRELRVDVAAVMAVRRKDGRYNFEAFLHQKAKQEKKPPPAVRIDRLRLKLGHVTFMDYTVRGDKPLIVRFDINLDKTYRNVRDLDALSKTLAKAVTDKITIGDIQNFEVKDLPDIARSALAAIPDETKDRIFGTGKDRDRVLKELAGRFSSKIKGKSKK